MMMMMICRVADAGDRRPASPLRYYHNWHCDADSDADHGDDYEHWDHREAEHHSEHDGLCLHVIRYEQQGCLSVVGRPPANNIYR